MVVECPALQDDSDVLVGRLQHFPVQLEIDRLRDPIHKLGEILTEHRGDDQTSIDVLPFRGKTSDLCLGEADAAAGGTEDRTQLYCSRGCISRGVPLIGLM